MTQGEGDAVPARRFVDSEGRPADSWLPAGFEAQDDSPPIGSVAAGAWGVGFDLFVPGQGRVKAFDSAGNEVPESLVNELLPDALKDYAERYGLPSPPEAPESLDMPSAAGAPESLDWTLEGPAETQEEALRSTALPGRVEMDAGQVAERAGVRPRSLGLE